MDLSLRSLEQAVSIRRQIDRLQSKLNGLLHGASTLVGGNGSRRRMSAQTRAKLAAAARARWAKQKAGTRNSSAGGKRKGNLTPAGRRKLSQMMKARWAARRRAAGKR
jgi:hypothetical protein